MKRIKSYILIVSVLMSVLYLVPFPQRIDVTLEGVMWTTENSKFEEAAEVSIHGWYLRYLFKDSVFRSTPGDNTYFTKLDPERCTLYNKITIVNGTMQLVYYDSVANELRGGGALYFTGSFENVTISLSGDVIPLTEDGGYFITAPASDRADALSVTNEILSKIWSADFFYE